MTRIHFGWLSPARQEKFPAAVSLHGHTQHSRENLSFAGAWLRSNPVLDTLARKAGCDLSFSSFWWTPPLPPGAAVRVESDHIERALDAQALVSITDHDQIAACRVIELLHGVDASPISLEWSVPLGPSFVHLGVHNLPRTTAETMFAAMQEYTAAPCQQRLADLLAWVNEDPATLVVLNHPMWDEARVGAAGHEGMIRTLLDRCRGRIHALELNGLRSWRENSRVLGLAREVGLPAVSGGDRHGSEPSACFNLTHAASFAQFAAEVRTEGQSTVLFTPRYAESHRVRQLEATWDLIREYPEYPERARWTDRAFLDDAQGVTRSLAQIWRSGEPLLARAGYQLFRAFRAQWLRPALRLATARRQGEPAN